MSKWIHTTVQAIALSVLPFIVDAGSAPTVFAPADANALRDRGLALDAQTPDTETMRRIALVVVDDASRRTEGTIAQIQADQAFVLTLADLAGNDPEILAIHANLLGVEAGLEDDLIRVLTLAKASSRSLDKLVRDNPEVGGTYMQRGLNALYSPPIAGRIQIAIDDFEKLSSSEFDLSDAGRAEVLLLLAQSYLKAGRAEDAQPLLTQVAQANVPRWSDAAKSVLADL